MANAQLLIVARGLSEIPAEDFRRAVEAAARAQGLGPGPWTYDATPSEARRASDSALVERVTSGPWEGFEITLGTTVPDAPHRVVISAFRQNLIGIPDSGDTSSIFGRVIDAVRGALTRPGVVMRIGFRTLRNTVSWDRGIPRSIDLSAGGVGGSSVGLVAVLGIAAIAMTVAGRRSGALSGTCLDRCGPRDRKCLAKCRPGFKYAGRTQVHAWTGKTWRFETEAESRKRAKAAKKRRAA